MHFVRESWLRHVKYACGRVRDLFHFTLRQRSNISQCVKHIVSHSASPNISLERILDLCYNTPKGVIIIPNYTYNVEAYNDIMQTELYKLWGIGVLLLIVLIAMVVYSVVLIREDKKKKFPYVQLIGVVLISVFLMVSFGSSIVSHSNDLDEEAYIQYEGPATITKRKKVVWGNIPTWYNEYVVSFNNNGEQVELSTRKDYEKEGNIDQLYIVYAQKSGIILEFVE